MKKITLFAAMAAVALAGNAQNILTGDDVYVKNSVTDDKQIFDVIVACDEVMQGLKDAGKTVNDYRTDDVTRWLYVWNETFVAGNAMMPGIGYEGFSSEGYTSLDVANVGWSGAGFNVNKGAGVDFSHFTKDTRFHACFMSNNAPAAAQLTILDMDGVNAPAKVALGSGNAEFVAVGPKLTDEWVAIDMSFADLAKVCPSFNYTAMATDSQTGNVLAFLAGGVAGQNICIDAVYFYTTVDNSGIDGIEIDDANAPVEFYNLQGVRVDNPENGLYIRRQGTKATKVVL